MELLILAFIVMEIASGGAGTATAVGAVGGAAKELAGETAKGYRQWNGKRTAKLAGSRGGRAWLAVESVAAGGARGATHGVAAAGRGAWRGQKTARAKRHEVRRRAVAVVREKVAARRQVEPEPEVAAGGTSPEPTDDAAQGEWRRAGDETAQPRVQVDREVVHHSSEDDLIYASDQGLAIAAAAGGEGEARELERRARERQTSPATDGEGSTTQTGTPSSGGANVADMDTEKAPAVLQAWRRLAKEVEAQVEADDTNGWALSGDQDALESVKGVLAAKEADLAELVTAAEGTKNKKAEQFRE